MPASGNIVPLRLVKLSTGGSAVINNATNQAIVIDPGSAQTFTLGPNAWSQAEGLVAAGKAHLLSAADVAALGNQTGMVPMLSGAGSGLPQ